MAKRKITMAAIKNFTSLEQSKKLAEFLPLESADMVYTMTNGYHTPWVRIEKIDELDKDDVCAWSLAALFSVLPHIQEFYPTLEKINDKYVCRYKSSGIWTNGDNPVDACVDMIIKLHEKKIL